MTPSTSPGPESYQLAQLTVARTLASSSTLDEAAPVVLRVLCDVLEWDLAELWVVDRKAGVARLFASWQRPTFGADAFIDGSRNTTFERGVGLPGRVWQDRQPLWVDDLSTSTSFVRGTLAALSGLHSALALPIEVTAAVALPIEMQRQILGALLCFGGDAREPDGVLLEAMTVIASQAGQFIERAQANAFAAGQNHVVEMIAMNAPLADILTSLTLLIESQAEGMLCSIVFLDEDKQHLRHGAAPSLPEPYVESIDGARIGPQAGSCGTAMYLGKPVIVTDILEDPLWANYRHIAAPHGLRACWSTPIRSSDGAVLGSFAMYYRDVRSPSPRETQLIEIATHIAGIAISRKQADEALIRSREQYAALVNSIDGVVWEADAGTLHLTFVSPQVERYLGYPVEQWLAEPDFWADCLHPDDRDWAVKLRAQAVLDRKDREFPHRMIGVDGRVVWLHDFINVVMEDGRVSKLRGVMVDVTERRRLEEQFSQAQRLEALGALAGGVAHDFNNLLTVILGFGEELCDALPQGQTTREAAEEIMKAGVRAASLTRQLLAFSRRQVLAPEILSLNTVVANTHTMLRRLIGEHIKIVTSTEPALQRVKADAGQMELALMNLAVNARDAMSGGGELTIETRNVDLEEAFTRAHPEVHPGPHVMLAIRDTGHGMSEDVVGRAFEPFYTTKEQGKGTGLGLATVYGIVRQSEGAVVVESTVGHGSAFKIYLPAVMDASVEAPPARANHIDVGGDETVLLVEDEEPLRKLVRTMLEKGGYRVFEAGDGLRALEVFHHGDEQPQLLVTDVVMPGMGGVELATRLRSLQPDLRVLYMSGYIESAIMADELREGRGDYIQKPLTRIALLRKVREVLDSVR